MRPRGGLIAGTLPTWTTTATSGVFTLREAQEMRTSAQWPRGPVAPTSLTATAGNAQLLLSWTAPATTHGTITNYLVEYTPSGGSAAYVLTGSNSTSYTLTGLTNGTSYTVRVAAVNFTAGEYSGTATGTPASVAVTVSPATITSNGGSLGGGTVFTWSGEGTAGNKLTTGGSLRQGRFSTLGSGGVAGFRIPQFSCGASGTLYFEWGSEDDGDGGDIYGSLTQYRKNGSLSTTFATSQVNSSQLSNRGISVSSGDTISLETFAVSPPFTPWRAWIQ